MSMSFEAKRAQTLPGVLVVQVILGTEILDWGLCRVQLVGGMLIVEADSHSVISTSFALGRLHFAH